MKIVHFAEYGPNGCGLYHTAKDLIKAEIGVGIDAHMVAVTAKDNKPVLQGIKTDGWLTTSDISVADDADILVRHTIIPNNLENRGIPIVMALHGRPHSTLLLDDRGISGPILLGFRNKGQDCRQKAFVTFWKEHLDFWKMMIPAEKVHYVPAMVDLMDWRPEHKPFHFADLAGKPNILIADIWREDIQPFEEVTAVRRFILDHCPSARLHIIAAPVGKGATAMWTALRNEGVLGYVTNQSPLIKEFYAAADVVVTPHTIATRIHREARASGTPVITSDKLADWYKSFQANPGRLRRGARRWAEKHYNLHNAGVAIKQVFDGILNQKPKRRKVFIDLGGHLGETVRRFYREVEDARFYKIHTYEPHPECHKKLCEIVGRMKNVVAWPIAVCANKGDLELWPGSVNNADGSTTLPGKKTGGIDYKKPYVVKGVGLADVVRQIRAGSNAPDTDYLVLKMNIEGGEYDLMEHILEQNLLKYFDQIYIQTHAEKLSLSKRNHYRQIEAKFRLACKEANVDLFMQDKGMAVFQCSQD